MVMDSRLHKVRSRVRDAIFDGSIHPVFQPIVSLQDGHIHGFEVLARWQDGEIGSIRPDEFIPVAEEVGLLDQMLGSFIQASLAAASAWPDHMVLAFNVSPSQLRQQGLPELVQNLADKAGFPLSRIHVEITETAMFSDQVVARNLLQQLRGMGVSIALDDFGTGHSSLTWLQTLPFSTIKLDTSFVRSMLEDRHSLKIVSAIVGLGQNLGLSVIAEGVESEQQARHLAKIGCDLAQGYLFSPPARAEHVPELIEKLSPTKTTMGRLPLSLDRRLAQMAALHKSDAITIAFLDVELRIVDFNTAFLSRLMQPGERLIGRRITELLPNVSARIDELNFQRAAPRAAPMFEFDTPSGGTELIGIQLLFDEADELLGYSVFGLDITERKKIEAALQASEDHHRHTQELSLAMPWTADPNGRFIEISPRTPVMQQGVPVNELQNLGWLEHVHSDHVDKARHAWMNALRTGENYDIEFLLHMGEGVFRWHHAYATPRRDANGRIVLWYGTTVDINERKQLELALKETQSALNQSDIVL